MFCTYNIYSNLVTLEKKTDYCHFYQNIFKCYQNVRCTHQNWGAYLEILMVPVLKKTINSSALSSRFHWNKWNQELLTGRHGWLHWRFTYQKIVIQLWNLFFSERNRINKNMCSTYRIDAFCNTGLALKRETEHWSFSLLYFKNLSKCKIYSRSGKGRGKSRTLGSGSEKDSQLFKLSLKLIELEIIYSQANWAYLFHLLKNLNSSLKSF